MRFVETEIDGVVIIEPDIFKDDRGYFFESYNRDKFFQNGIKNIFVQDNQSKSSYGVIRGLHCQNGEHAQAKLVRVLDGSVLDVAVDIREDSKTFGKYVAVELSADSGRELFIPRGFLHGFAVLSQSAIFAYKCDNLYNKESESGVRFDDVDIGIDWGIPKDKIAVSDKDILLGGLRDVAHYRR